MSDTEETTAPNAQDDPIAYDIIRKHAIEADQNYKRYLDLLNQALKDRHATISDFKAIKQGLVNYAEKAVDWAAKLLPYEMPKLESVELKAQTEHKFVMVAPASFKTVDEWAAVHNVQQKIIENQIDQAIDVSPPVPSVHDYNAEEDEIATNQQLNTSKRH